MAVGDMERAPRRRPGTRSHLRAYTIPGAVYRYFLTRGSTSDDARHARGGRDRPLEVIIFFRCQRSDTLEHYAADTPAPQRPLFVTLDEVICRLPRVGRRRSFESHPEVADSTRARLCSSRDGNRGWDCSFSEGHRTIYQISRYAASNRTRLPRRPVISRLLQSVGVAHVKYLVSPGNGFL